ncbi:helix-turn-helix transcriptional regulator [Bradyrhizobium sp. 138]|uniref:helix-turn-helix domain-containing protein n=1 Tax=Bradyrhizobium sp. 138 TaxID=2782615 RepID=UPI001FF9E8E4|nr:helix-turn-helix transcriptional regulator [Bradyrhizobium sp. 138]MCK1738777.1 helix-turn-helix transcriptional regulator [Bradyrhizobium sp. 138]
MDVTRRMPHPALRGIIRSFEERRGTFGPEGLTWPLAARPHQIIDIYLGDPFHLRIDGGRLQAAPETVVVGPQGSRRIQLFMSGEIHIFNILLQPAALNRLVGIDMTALVNEGVPASDVLGKRGMQLSDAVRSAADFSSRVVAAERCFGMMQDGSPAPDGIDFTSRVLLGSRGRVRIDQLAKQSGLSARHFQRRFTTQVGLSPKLYARTVRFDAALMAHRNEPTRPWTGIIHEAGYFDQAHFIRECHALVGTGPGQFVGDWDNILSPVG